MSSHPGRSLVEIASAYDTDKAASSYIDYYDRYFSPLRQLPVRLLELGILRGGSLLMWEEYFAEGIIVGLDLDEVALAGPHERVRIYQGRQEDMVLLDRIAEESAPQGFDIIIDDAAHFGALARASFWHLFEHHLKPGGIYVIEDWGTGYWQSWPDGAEYRALRQAPPSLGSRIVSKFARLDPRFNAHNFGMVGLIKELVDECGMGDITHGKYGVPPTRESRIEEMSLRHGQALVRKKTRLT
jgi:SAM-dependent methyltransferase